MPRINARGMLRPGSRISSASGVTLVQPSYAQSTLTIAAIIPLKIEPTAVAPGQNGSRLARRSADAA